MHDDDEMEKEVEHILNFKGSLKGRRIIHRDRIVGARLFYKDYFQPKQKFHEGGFQRRFGMNKPLFLRVIEGVEAHGPYFTLRKDCYGQLAFSPLQKCTAALRMLALGTATNVVGEIVQMGESTCLDALSILPETW